MNLKIGDVEIPNKYVTLFETDVGGVQVNITILEDLNMIAKLSNFKKGEAYMIESFEVNGAVEMEGIDITTEERENKIVNHFVFYMKYL